VVAVRLADAAGLLLAAPGRHVDVLAAAGAGAGAPSDVAATGPAELVTADAVVLAVPEPAGAGTAGDAGGGALTGVLGGSAGAPNGSGGLAGVVVLAVHPGDVPRLAAGGARALSLALPLPPA
jgi:hypothetical protein